MRPSICRTPHTCVQCGEAFFPKRTDRLTFCGRPCAYAHQQDQKRARIAKAEKDTATRKARAKADREAARLLRSVKPAILLVCVQCGDPYSVTQPSGRKFCSTRCSRRAAKAKHRAMHGSSTHRQRARLAGVSYEPVDPLDIMRRDRWRCQVCGRPAPQRLRGTTDPRAPELDHIVPLALKGPHTAANLQCACRQCNIEKGAQWRGQTRLFG